jgi:hypothetical protein
VSSSTTKVIGSAGTDATLAFLAPFISYQEQRMCRNIRTLFNFEPPTTDDEIRASALQFVRKLSGFAKPSRANEAAFNRAIARWPRPPAVCSDRWKRRARRATAK